MPRENAHRKRPYNADKRERRRSEACVGKHAQGQRRKGKDAVEGEVRHFTERIFGRARVARFAPVRDAGLPEAGPRAHGAQQAVALRHGEQGVDYAAVQQAEVAGVEWNIDIRQAVDDAVEKLCRPELEARFTRAVHAHAVDHMRARLPRLHHGGDDFRRVLKIGVDDDHSAAPREGKPGGNGLLVAEISGQMNDNGMGIGGVKTVQHCPGRVARAIVDK